MVACPAFMHALRQALTVLTSELEYVDIRQHGSAVYVGMAVVVCML